MSSTFNGTEWPKLGVGVTVASPRQSISRKRVHSVDSVKAPNFQLARKETKNQNKKAKANKAYGLGNIVDLTSRIVDLDAEAEANDADMDSDNDGSDGGVPLGNDMSVAMSANSPRVVSRDGTPSIAASTGSCRVVSLDDTSSITASGGSSRVVSLASSDSSRVVSISTNGSSRVVSLSSTTSSTGMRADDENIHSLNYELPEKVSDSSASSKQLALHSKSDSLASKSSLQSTGSYTFSKTWISDEEKEYQTWLKVRAAIARIAPKSDMLPVTYHEWLQQRIDFNLLNQVWMWEKMEAKVQASMLITVPCDIWEYGGFFISGSSKVMLVSAPEIAPPTPFPVEHGSWKLTGMAAGVPNAWPKQFARDHSLSKVLSLPTIWRTGYEDVPGATPNWPSLQELKWEGDDRSRSGFGRFLPIPRQPCNSTVAWHHQAMAPSFDLDRVHRLQDMFGPPACEMDKDPDFEMEFINSELWDAIHFGE